MKVLMKILKTIKNIMSNIVNSGRMLIIVCLFFLNCFRRSFSNNPFDGFDYSATQDQNFSKQNTSHGKLNNGLTPHSNRTIRGHLIMKPGLTDSKSKVKRITQNTGNISFLTSLIINVKIVAMS